jgi:hypothetical protein
VEEKNDGDVKWATYSYYIAAGGWGKFMGVRLCNDDVYLK